MKIGIRMLLFYLAIAYASSKTEEGFLYSVGRNRFLTHIDNLIRFASPRQKPGLFSITKGEGESSGSLLIRPVPWEGDRLADMTRSGTHEWDLYPIRGTGGWNQLVKMSLMPDGMLKLKVYSYCLEVHENMVVGATCRPHGEDRNQLFRWVPKKHMRAVKDWVVNNRKREGEHHGQNDSWGYEHNHEYHSNGHGGDTNEDSGHEDSRHEDASDGHHFGFDEHQSKNNWEEDGYGGIPEFHVSSDGSLFDSNSHRRRRRYDESPVDDGDEDGHTPEGSDCEFSPDISRGKIKHGSLNDLNKGKSGLYSRYGKLNEGATENNDDSRLHCDPTHFAVNARLFAARGVSPCNALVIHHNHPSVGSGNSQHEIDCNPRDPAAREICGINKTTMNFMRSASIPV